jgi:nucleotide-binding universal stress UspA family protein
MINLKRILVPTDFSPHSKQALTYGCAFAEKFGAELHLLHVVQDLVAMVPEPGLAFPPPGDYMKELSDSAARSLLTVPDAGWSAGKTIVRSVRQGPPFLEIIRYAREAEIDLIVLGTHGRTGLTHVLLGSVAEKVVRKGPCPVLTVRLEEHEFVAP